MIMHVSVPVFMYVSLAIAPARISNLILILHWRFALTTFERSALHRWLQSHPKILFTIGRLLQI